MKQEAIDKIDNKIADECNVGSQEFLLRKRWAIFGYNLAMIHESHSGEQQPVTGDGKGRGKEYGTPFERLAYWGTHSGWRYCQGGERCGNEPILKLSHFEKMVDRIEKDSLASQPPTPEPAGELYRFVKASERLPKRGWKGSLRIGQDTGFPHYSSGAFELNTIRVDIWNHPYAEKEFYKNIEWLEKVEPQQNQDE